MAKNLVNQAVEDHTILSDNIQATDLNRFQTLPEELLLNILSYLSLDELCNTVPNVCQQWQRLHWDRQLYRVPIVGDSERGRPRPIIEDLFRVLEASTRLASPYFDEVNIRATIKTCEEFHNEQADLKKFHNECYKDLIILLSHLQVVNISSTAWDNVVWTRIIHLMSFCVQLEELKVVWSLRITNTELIALCGHLWRNLRVLDLGCNGDWTFEGVNCITRCSQLQDLTIHAVRVFGQPASSRCLLPIANMPSLRHLKFSGFIEPSSSTWISMFSNSALKDLTSLCLHECSFNNEDGVVIGAYLENLTSLYISAGYPNYWTGHIGVTGMQSILRGCKKLTKLSWTCKGDRIVVTTIMTVPKYLPQLKELTVFCPEVKSMQWKRKLKEKMPDLVISECSEWGLLLSSNSRPKRQL